MRKRIGRNLGLILGILLMMQKIYGQNDCFWKELIAVGKASYPDTSLRLLSKGNMTYYVNPETGSDHNKGTKASIPWKTFSNINALKFAPGDTVIIAAGTHGETLMPFGKGTKNDPIVIKFLPGLHEFTSPKALHRIWHISNTSDYAFKPKPCGILVEGTTHLRILGGGVSGPQKTTVMMSGPARMMQLINHYATDITYQNLVFDLKRPSVSEIIVLQSTRGEAVIQIAEGSTYEIKNGKFKWTGDLGFGWMMAQVADLKTRKAERLGRWSPFDSAVATDLGEGKVRLSYADNDCTLEKGKSYGFRCILHDMATFFNARSKDVSFLDCEINAMSNMSFVSQFTENLHFQHVNVIALENTHRVSPSSMDIFHFANCKGQILIDSCKLSGAGDDGANYHGINIGIIGQPSPNQLHLRFLQQQTFGFAPCAPGDELAVINHLTLLEIKNNPRRKVLDVQVMPGDRSRKNWIVTLDGPAPKFKKGDVVDNLSWQADLTFRNNLIELASCRGILATSRGKIVIENNIINTLMPGVLIEDDANKWWESSPVRDLLIKNNTFLNCGIDIAPQIVRFGGQVHQNIRIIDNKFIGQAKTNPTATRGVVDCPFITVRGVKGLTITGNKFPGELSVLTTECANVRIENNLLHQKNSAQDFAIRHYGK